MGTCLIGTYVVVGVRSTDEMDNAHKKSIKAGHGLRRGRVTPFESPTPAGRPDRSVGEIFAFNAESQ